MSEERALFVSVLCSPIVVNKFNYSWIFNYTAYFGCSLQAKLIFCWIRFTFIHVHSLLLDKIHVYEISNTYLSIDILGCACSANQSKSEFTFFGSEEIYKLIDLIDLIDLIEACMSATCQPKCSQSRCIVVCVTLKLITGTLSRSSVIISLFFSYIYNLRLRIKCFANNLNFSYRFLCIQRVAVRGEKNVANYDWSEMCSCNWISISITYFIFGNWYRVIIIIIIFNIINLRRCIIVL